MKKHEDITSPPTTLPQGGDLNHRSGTTIEAAEGSQNSQPSNGFYMEVIDDTMADVLRQKSEAERLKIADRMWRSARTILRGAIQTEHPDWNVDQVNREIAHRISHGVVPHGTD